MVRSCRALDSAVGRFSINAVRARTRTATRAKCIPPAGGPSPRWLPFNPLLTKSGLGAAPPADPQGILANADWGSAPDPRPPGSNQTADRGRGSRSRIAVADRGLIGRNAGGGDASGSRGGRPSGVFWGNPACSPTDPLLTTGAVGRRPVGGTSRTRPYARARVLRLW